MGEELVLQNHPTVGRIRGSRRGRSGLESHGGELDRKLDALTERHGYGLLRTRPGHLGPLGLTRKTPA